MMPTPEQVTGFADGLIKVRDAEKAGTGATLTATEVSGLLWAIKQLRGGIDDATGRTADRNRAETSGS